MEWDVGERMTRKLEAHLEESPWMEGRSRRFSAEDDLSQPTQNSEKDRHVDFNPSSVTSLAGRSFV